MRKAILSETIQGENWLGEDMAAARLLNLIACDKRVPVRLLLHPSRCRASVAATRQLAMYLMHVSLGRSLSDVGRMFGRDRTTVSHACARIEDMRDLPRFDEDVTRLETVLAEPEEAHNVAR